MTQNPGEQWFEFSCIVHLACVSTSAVMPHTAGVIMHAWNLLYTLTSGALCALCLQLCSTPA